MESSWSRRLAGLERWCAAHERALATGALVALLGLALATRWVSRGQIEDLFPRPDAVEFAASARSLLERGTYAFPVNGLAAPPTAPFGFPMLLAPAYLVAGHALPNAWYAVLVMALAEVALVFRLGRRVYGVAGGIVAAAVVVASPLDASLGRLVMSDVASAVAVLAAVSVALDSARPSRALLAGALAGAACWVRLIDAVLAPALLVAVVAAHGTRVERARRGALFLAGLAAAVGLLLLHHRQAFGSALTTGYAYWEPYVGTRFDLSHAVDQDRAIRYAGALGGMADDSLGFDLRLYSPVAALLAVAAGVGAILAPGESPARPAALLGGIALVTVATFSVYYWPVDLRYVHLAVPTVAVLAGGGASWVLRRTRGNATLGVAAAMGVWLVLEIVGVTRSMGAWTAAIPKLRPRWQWEVATVPAILGQLEPDARLVTDQVDPAYFGAMDWPGNTRRISYLMHPPWRGGDTTYVDSVGTSPDAWRRLLAAGRPVYLLASVEAVRGITAKAGVVLAPAGAPNLQLWRVSQSGDRGAP